MNAEMQKYMPIAPMLIGRIEDPFDDTSYLYELKFDGERCIAYLDTNETVLLNKRDLHMLPKLPELCELHHFVRKPCILDGELIVMVDGKPDFSQIQRRSLMSNSIRVEVAAKKYPATLVVFDILYLDGAPTTNLPLMERKKLLEEVVMEGARLSVSRYIEGQGKAFYALAEKEGLEGIVAKQKKSKYFPGKRTKEWAKIKNTMDDDFIVCGYIIKSPYITSLIIGQYNAQGKLIYKGHVTMGISREDFGIIERQKELGQAPFEDYPQTKDNALAVWLEPGLVCTVQYMMLTPGGGLRHPVYKGLRMDKAKEACIAPALE